MDKVLKTAKDGRKLYREGGRFIWKKPGTETGSETGTESASGTGTESAAGSGTGLVHELGGSGKQPAFRVGETYTGTGTETGAIAGTETGAEAGTESGTKSGRKRRGPGRPRNTETEKSNVSVKLDAKLFASQIQGAHQLAALVLKNPGWALTDDEAQSLAIAMIDVSKQYQFNFNPKLIAWLKLATVSAMIYGPRAAFLLPQKKTKAQVLPFASPGTVAQPGGQTTGPNAPVNAPANEAGGVDIEWPPKTKLKLNT